MWEMGNFIRDTLVTLVLTIGVFLLVQSTIQVSVVNGSSMEPELHHGQRLIVNKVAYRFGEATRGDIVVFKPPTNPNSIPFIKRIIALPGETVEVRRGVVYINNVRLDEPYIKELASYNFPQEKVPPESFFVLGDNRNNTSDSHVWGTVPAKNIIGKAAVSIWPPDEWGPAPNYSFGDLLSRP